MVTVIIGKNAVILDNKYIEESVVVEIENARAMRVKDRPCTNLWSHFRKMGDLGQCRNCGYHAYEDHTGRYFTWHI